MYIPLGIRSDYSLLQSLIKIPELIDVLKTNSITAIKMSADIFISADTYLFSRRKLKSFTIFLEFQI